MRNLYRYQSSPETPQINLKRIIDAMADSEEKADCAAVLCTPSRKKVYDAVWTAMTDIGTLRSSLRPPENNSFPSSFRLNQATRMRGLNDFRESIQRHEGTAHSAQKRQVPQSAGTPHKKGAGGNFSSAIRNLFVVGGCLYLLILLLKLLGSSVDNPDIKLPTLAQPAPIPALPLPPPKPLPASGTLNSYLPGLHANMDAPFEIRTSAGANYLLKMEHWESGRAILDVFVRGGDRVEIKVPVGTYRVKYASGKTWYGYEDLFGPRTSFSKADTSFQFKRTFDGYSGYTITLYKVQNGNLSTSKIGASDF